MLPDKQTVWVETRGHQVPRQVVQTASTPRSYVVQPPSGQLRRNLAYIYKFELILNFQWILLLQKVNFLNLQLFSQGQ